MIVLSVPAHWYYCMMQEWLIVQQGNHHGVLMTHLRYIIHTKWNESFGAKWGKSSKRHKKRCNADQRLRGWHPCISKYSKFASIFYIFFLFSYVFYLSEYVTHSPTHPLPERIIQQHRRQKALLDYCIEIGKVWFIILIDTCPVTSPQPQLYLILRESPIF